MPLTNILTRISRTALAERLGVSATAVQNWLRRGVPRRRLAELEQIEQELFEPERLLQEQRCVRDVESFVLQHRFNIACDLVLMLEKSGVDLFDEEQRTLALDRLPGLLWAHGKIRAIGVSNYSPEQMAAFRATAPLHTAQPPYNLFERDIEHDVLPYCRQHGILTLTYGALCRGLLSGRMSAETQFQGDDLRRLDPKFRAPRFAQYLTAVERLDRFARDRYGKRVIHLAVRWLLDRTGVGVALWGARKPAQLDPIAEVMGWALDEGAMAEIDRIVAECVPEPIGPEFMAPPLQRPRTRGNANA
jgi:transcriptional regulator with XRE-family HTH domain